MGRFEVGVQLYPQHTDVGDLRDAWSRAEDLGVDSIWTWDHFFPISEEGEGAAGHLEAWTLLAATAVATERVRIGVLVSSVSYRNPNLLVDMATTIDHLSGGRVVLGLGAGWFERDHEEYGFPFGSPAERLERLEDALATIRRRLPELDPQPIGELPVLVGGGGEKVTLRLVARFADWWNGFGPPEDYVRKNRILDEHCRDVGRDPAEITRTAQVKLHELDVVDGFLDAGATHLIVGLPHPYDLGPAERLLHLAEDG